MVCGELLARLSVFAHQTGFGRVFPSEVGYQCFPDDPEKVRKPDVSFVCKGRLPGGRIPRGHVRIAPDLAVEVISPGDLYYEVSSKVHQYLAAGITLAWVVDPETRTIEVRRADGSATVLTEADELSGESVLPGFRCPVKELFLTLDPQE